MKFLLKIVVYTFLISLTSITLKADKGNSSYHLQFQIKGLEPDSIYLVNYVGDRVMYFDTAMVSNNGSFEFKTDKQLKVGMYAVFYQGRILVQFIGKETNMRLATDTLDYINNMKVENTLENETLYGFFQFANKSNKDSKALRDQLSDVKKGSDKEKELNDGLKKMQSDFNAYRDGIIENNKDLFISALLKARIEPEIPEIPFLADGVTKDSTFRYRYYKSHYFDNIDLSDRRLHRTDVMHQKVFFYLDKLTPMMPDSIIISVDEILKRTKEDSVTFRYFASKLLYRYDTSKVVGMSNVLFHIGNKYYLKDKAYWMDSTQMAKVKERVEMLRYNQIGSQAIDLRLPDLEGNIKTISEIRSKHTVLFFYDASCGHCKKTAPKLLDLYHKYGEEVLSVYAVEGTSDRKKWEEFVSDLKLDWINVSDPQRTSHFRQYYDVTSYPAIYLLNKKKTIKLKKVSVETIGEAIERGLKESDK